MHEIFFLGLLPRRRSTPPLAPAARGPFFFFFFFLFLWCTAHILFPWVQRIVPYEFTKFRSMYIGHLDYRVVFDSGPTLCDQ